MKYFTDITTLDELKKEYRRLSLINHPDVGGDLETMKSINADHDTKFESLKKQHNETADEYHQTTETAEEFRDILEKIANLEGLDIELCGSWLWISGNTKEHKEVLKASGCGWSNNKKMWYWRHPEDGRKHRKGSKSIDDIRVKYGSEKISGASKRTSTLGATA